MTQTSGVTHVETGVTSHVTATITGETSDIAEGIHKLYIVIFYFIFYLYPA